ncbi:GIN domain-containing protein [Acinetobacter johnsonii]|uniref:GIN domain-containing protein n=1 Tax=Acinetobacter johnsonii TaxID=40214 RepID=UPI000A934FB8|nr:DUF2807 domain-containing protein [Acinetobacter johnsonii]
MSKHIFSGSVVINGNGNVYSSGSNYQIVGSGKPVTKQVPVNPFNEICMKGPMSLKFFASSVSKMEITADDNIVDLISATFQGGVLVLAANYWINQPAILVYGLPVILIPSRPSRYKTT